jgi:hypothetical protein
MLGVTTYIFFTNLEATVTLSSQSLCITKCNYLVSTHCFYLLSLVIYSTKKKEKKTSCWILTWSPKHNFSYTH